MHRRFAIFALLPLCLASILTAQDTRKVVEPVLPRPCAVLDAQLQTAGRSLAPGDETRLDTGRIQKAIDTCAKGRGVLLQPHGSANAFLSGPLQLRPGVTLIVAAGATLYASRNPELYATTSGSCGVVADSDDGCKALINVLHAPNAAVMGNGTIDGRGGETMLGTSVPWWQLALQARNGLHQQVPRIIYANHSSNFTLYRITLKNSPFFHVVYEHGDGFTVWGIRIDTPKDEAHNADGIDPGQGTRNITITRSFVRTGDDHVALKAGHGGVTNMTVSHNHFYWGHGMSIGSETYGGASSIRVFDLSLDGPDDGIRIKSNSSRGGLVHNVVYDDVCIRNSPHPIILDEHYVNAGTQDKHLYPSTSDITFHNVRISGGGKFTFSGYSSDYRVSAILDGVQITDSATYTYALSHADIRLGPSPTNLELPVGEDSTQQGTASKGAAASCSEKFIPFPL